MAAGSKRAKQAKQAKRATTAAVRYRVDPVDPKGHYFEIVCDIREPDAAGQQLVLPAWIPGSYMIREFARNIVAISATSAGRPLPLTKLDKHTWRADPTSSSLQVRYRVYSWDPSVRAAHLDETHGFFNGTSVFLRAIGHEAKPHEVELVAPRGAAFRGWRVATTLPTLHAKELGFGSYRADDYDALIDHPVEMGGFILERFEAAGVPHAIALTGVVPNLDATRLREDLAVLCAAQIRFFQQTPAEPAPFDRFLFLTQVAGEGYGGLEHRASTALICSRDALPTIGASERTPAYRTFLGLASHEYFHSWNVKRIKPAAFAPYDLTRENYTSLLWIFEGFTSYYDDLFLVRSGLITPPEHVEMIAKVIDEVSGASGHKVQSVADSSFDAWTKFYRQDENAPNAIVSYYKKGSLVALCLDLHIRERSSGRKSLDDVMQAMWRRFGRDFYPGGRGGLDEDAFPALVLEATGVDVSAEVARWAYGTDELPLAALLAGHAMALRFEARQKGPSLGARIATAPNECRIAAVEDAGAAHRAGLAAGDVLVAIDGMRAAPGKVETILSRYRDTDVVEIVAFRGDLLQTRSLTLDEAPQRAIIEDAKGASKKAMARRERWLKG